MWPRGFLSISVYEIAERFLFCVNDICIVTQTVGNAS